MLFLDMLHIFKAIIDMLPRGSAFAGAITDNDLAKVDGSKFSMAKFMDNVKANFPNNLAYELQFPESPIRKLLNQQYAMCFRLDEYVLMLHSQEALSFRLADEASAAMRLQEEADAMEAQLKDLMQQVNLQYQEELEKKIKDYLERSADCDRAIRAYNALIEEQQAIIEKNNIEIDRELTSLISISEKRAENVSEIIIKSINQDIAVIENAKVGLQQTLQHTQNELNEARTTQNNLPAGDPAREEVALIISQKESDIEKLNQTIQLQNTYLNQAKTLVHDINDSMAKAKESSKNLSDIPSKQAALEALTQVAALSQFSAQKLPEMRKELLKETDKLLSNVNGAEAFHGEVISKQMSNIEEMNKLLDENDIKQPGEKDSIIKVHNLIKRNEHAEQKIEDKLVSLDGKRAEKISLIQDCKALQKDLNDLKNSPGPGPGRRP